MAKKKSSDEFAVGMRVRVKSETALPEFPDVACGGWTGTITEVSGKKPNTKYFIEWDEATLAMIPAHYVQACETRGLLHGMVCLDGSALEPAG